MFHVQVNLKKKTKDFFRLILFSWWWMDHVDKLVELFIELFRWDRNTYKVLYNLVYELILWKRYLSIEIVQIHPQLIMEHHVLVQVINIKHAMMLFLVWSVCLDYLFVHDWNLFFSCNLVITGNAGKILKWKIGLNYVFFCLW
jgi:hypothetical protein